MPKKFMDSICLLAILPLETGQGAGKRLWSLLLGNMVQSRRQRSKLWFCRQRRKGSGSTKEGQKTLLKKFPIWFRTYRACPLCPASFTSSLSWIKIWTLAAYRYPEEHFYKDLFTPSPTHSSQEYCGPLDADPDLLQTHCGLIHGSQLHGLIFPLRSLCKRIHESSGEASLSVSNFKWNCWGRKVGLCVGEFLQGTEVILKLRDGFWW